MKNIEEVKISLLENMHEMYDGEKINDNKGGNDVASAKE